MKKLITITSLISGLFLASPSWALMISGTGTDVGSEDQFIASADLSNSGSPTEAQWVNNVLGGTSGPDYYFLKLGVGKPGTADDHYLFKNLSDLNYAVVNFGSLNMGDLVFNLGRISHIAGYSGGTSVPEPSAAALMGLGLLMIGVISRRRKQQA